MNEMLERLACSMAAAEPWGYDPYGSDQNMREGGKNWELFSQSARAALLELRNPTDAMLHRIPGAQKDAREGSWLATWRDMIDEALK